MTRVGPSPPVSGKAAFFHSSRKGRMDGGRFTLGSLGSRRQSIGTQGNVKSTFHAANLVNMCILMEWQCAFPRAICNSNDGLWPVIFKIEPTDRQAEKDYTPVNGTEIRSTH